LAPGSACEQEDAGDDLAVTRRRKRRERRKVLGLIALLLPS
jgi:hypothetical protein